LLGIDDVTADVIRRFQPFNSSPAERTALWLLHRLWNTDKHRLVHAGYAIVPDASPTVQAIVLGEPESDLMIETCLTRGVLADGQVVIRFQLSSDTEYPDLNLHCEVPLDIAVGEERVPCHQLWGVRDNVVTILNTFGRSFDAPAHG
jgi:hypothetical protein